MSVEFYGVERYVTGGMHVLSVRPVLARVDNAAVDVSDRRNPETSSRIVILAHRVPRVFDCVGTFANFLRCTQLLRSAKASYAQSCNRHKLQADSID